MGDVERAGRKIIEEEQRLGALNDEVVDAHGDQVDADGGVQAGIDGDLELGADAVGGADEHRVAKAGGLEVEQRAEAADAAHGADAVGSAGERLDPVDQRVAGFDIHARVAIRHHIVGWGTAHRERLCLRRRIDCANERPCRKQPQPHRPATHAGSDA